MGAQRDAVDQLRLMTCGSVDDGKSTLIGRLLWETGSVPADEIERVRRESVALGRAFDPALLLDGLEAERAQQITIDIAWRYFGTARRRFVVADAPGHEEHTRNMVGAATQVDLAVLLADAARGATVQTLRHARLAAMFGVRTFVLAVNKMDAAGFDPAAFDRLVALGRRLEDELGAGVVAIPLSARDGDNVVARSQRTPWYGGPTLLEALEAAPVEDDAANRPLRLPVQWVNRADGFRGYAGSVASGRVRRGERVRVAGSGREATVARLLTPDGDAEAAAAGEAVTVVLEPELDIGRGEVLCAPDAPARSADLLTAQVVWLADQPLLVGRRHLLRIGAATVLARVMAVKHVLDPETGETRPARSLATNEIGVCDLALDAPVAFEPFAVEPGLGGLSLVDRDTGEGLAAGVVLHALRRADTVRAQALKIDRPAREALAGHPAAVVWFTGLSGSGKSTIADAVERRLHAAGLRTYLIDGDNLRLGLNRDLGFSDADRVENVRRAGEAARLLADAGTIVLCALISPFEADRRAVRERLGPVPFVEVFVDASIETCRARDAKGLYARADSGEIPNFTGVASPYEPPTAAEVVIDADLTAPGAAVEQVLAALGERIGVRA